MFGWEGSSFIISHPRRNNFGPDEPARKVLCITRRAQVSPASSETSQIVAKPPLAMRSKRRYGPNLLFSTSSMLLPVFCQKRPYKTTALNSLQQKSLGVMKVWRCTAMLATHQSNCHLPSSCVPGRGPACPFAVEGSRTQSEQTGTRTLNDKSRGRIT